MDFLQSASNSAASNVSAPVDAIAWLLRKTGVPVPANPLMGSDWMAQRGFTLPVQQNASSLAGETAGMVGPMALAAKAPQVANALLQGGRNLAAPRRLNPQTGAIVYHGSPHKFDAFDSSKIGTGEGAQAYGHGLYLAESPGVAASYQSALSKGKQATSLNDRMKLAQVGGKPLDSFGVDMSQDLVDAAKSGGPDFVSLLDSKAARWADLANDSSYPYQAYATDKLKAYSSLRQEAVKSGVDYTGDGMLYKVDLPDEKIARMLDWDKPLSQQAPNIQKLAGVKQRNMAAEEALIAKAQAQGVPVTSLPEYAQLEKLMDKAGKQSRMTGRDLYERFGGAATGADKMRAAGIPGIRYLDGGSRGAGTGTSNYVVFPGEENALRILERNGQKF